MRRAGRVAVPAVSALIGALATASVSWAAAHPMAAGVSTREASGAHPASSQRAVIRQDDRKPRTAIAPATSANVSAPATHTTSGASGG
jgi:hypothetical protein